MKEIFDAPAWCIDFIQVTEHFVEIRGWALAPREGAAAVSFTVNDLDFDLVQYPLVREDVGRVFWYIGNSRQSGFVCRSSLPKETIAKNPVLTFKFVNARTRESFKSEYDYYYLTSEDLILPPAENRRRVHGTNDEGSFRLAGYTTFVGLRQFLKSTFGRDYTDYHRILDWGCGCGRVTRYFGQLEEINITGVDIDDDNIRWCNKHLTFGRFQRIPLHPPTNLNSSFFDLVIGISVFTHLGEPEQYEWLSELRRLVSDGAILLMSVHGEKAVARTGSPELWSKLDSAGFVDTGKDSALEGYIRDTDYYRSVFHSAHYIRTKWSRFFDILAIIPGYIGNHQDLIVMRRK